MERSNIKPKPLEKRLIKSILLRLNDPLPSPAVPSSKFVRINPGMVDRVSLGNAMLSIQDGVFNDDEIELLDPANREREKLSALKHEANAYMIRMAELVQRNTLKNEPI